MVLSVMYYLYIYTSRTKNVDLKTGFLRNFFWTFIEFKRTIVKNDHNNSLNSL